MKVRKHANERYNSYRTQSDLNMDAEGPVKFPCKSHFVAYIMYHPRAWFHTNIYHVRDWGLVSVFVQGMLIIDQAQVQQAKLT